LPCICDDGPIMTPPFPPSTYAGSVPEKHIKPESTSLAAHFYLQPRDE
jgi:hypothetical protein